MNLEKFAVKIYFEAPAEFHRRSLVPVFQRWIQEDAIDGHILIDVVDYSHVAYGPGVLLIGHEADFSLDNADGRLGLLYTLKRSYEAPFALRVRSALSATFQAVNLLENDPVMGRQLKPDGGEIVFIANDRLEAPNTPEAYESLKTELSQILPDLIGRKYTLVGGQTGSDDRLTMRIQFDQSLDFTNLARQLNAEA